MKNEEKSVYLITNAIVEDTEEGIDVRALFAPILIYKWLMLLSSLLVIGVGVTLVMGLPPEHQVKTKLMLTQPRYTNVEQTSIGGRLGGAASLLGLGGTVNLQESQKVEIMKSSIVVEKFIEEYDLLKSFYPNNWDKEEQVWIPNNDGEIPTLRDGYEKFLLSVFKINVDDASGIIELSITWKDPDIAYNWAKNYVIFINKYLRSEEDKKIKNSISYLEEQLKKTTVKERKNILFNLIEKEVYRKVSVNVGNEFAITVLDPLANISDEGKKRKIRLVIILVFLGIGFGIATSYGIYFLTKLWKKS